MIDERIIEKAKAAYINRCGKTCSHDSLTAALEAVAADIWEDGYAACYARQLRSDRWPYPDEDEQAEKEYAEACGRNAAKRAPNPYRASETA